MNQMLSQEFVAGDAIPSLRQMKWLITILYAYFGIKLVFLAACISPYVPPDEVTHFGIARLFSQVIFLPDNSAASYQYGLVTNIPWLYYWLMGKLLNCNYSGISDLFFLRLLNIPLAFATVIYSVRLLGLLTDCRLARVLLVAAMTNTMMFTFQSAMVSYDNLVNMLAAMAIYYLFAHMKGAGGRTLLLSLLCQLLGCLCKKTFLPLVLILNLVLLAHEIVFIRRLPSRLIKWSATVRTREALLCSVVLVCLGLAISLYGGNYLRFGTIDPEMSMVLPVEAAMQNRLEARNAIFTKFKDGKLTVSEALSMARQISHPGDREAAIMLIEGYAEQQQGGLRLAGPGEYLVIWLMATLPGIYGIYAHLDMPNSGMTLFPVVAILLLALAGAFRSRSSILKGELLLSLSIVIVFYIAVLIYFVNYQTYRHFANSDISIQGRYVFPVLGAGYVLASHFLVSLFKRRYAMLTVAVLTILIFIACEFPLFLFKVTSEWFA